MWAAIFAYNIGDTISTTYSQLNEDPVVFLGNDYSEFLSSIVSESHLLGYR